VVLLLNNPSNDSTGIYIHAGILHWKIIQTSAFTGIDSRLILRMLFRRLNGG
jgi:hypothetical protein